MYAPIYTMATPNTPEQNSSKDLTRWYLIQYRRQSLNEEDIEARLITTLCKQEDLGVEKVTHIGTSITEKHLHIVLNYGDLDDTAAAIIVYKADKGMKMKQRQPFPNIATYIKLRVDDLIQRHNTQGIAYPIKDEVFQYPMLWVRLTHDMTDIPPWIYEPPRAAKPYP